jgi:hypothetical protein
MLPGVNGLGGRKDVDGVTLPEPEAVVDGVGPPDGDVVDETAPEEDIVMTCERDIVADTHAEELAADVPLDDARGERVNDIEAVTDPDKVRNAVGRVADAEIDAETIPETVDDIKGDADLFAEGEFVATPELDAFVLGDAAVVVEAATDREGSADTETLADFEIRLDTVGDIKGDADLFAEGEFVATPELDAFGLGDAAGDEDAATD